MKANPFKDRVVYSTDQGKMCPECGQVARGCLCRRVKLEQVGDGIVRVSRETKGRKGKGVTLIKGVALEPVALAALVKKLKTLCGSGGTIKDGIIEIQGDHGARVMEYLSVQGMRVKRAGG